MEAGFWKVLNLVRTNHIVYDRQKYSVDYKESKTVKVMPKKGGETFKSKF